MGCIKYTFRKQEFSTLTEQTFLTCLIPQLIFLKFKIKIQ